MRKSFLIVLLIINVSVIFSQEKEKKWELNGYVKDMQTVIVGDFKENWITDNMLHNRLNYKWYPHEHFNLVLEMRNRLIWGELISMESILPDSLLLFRYTDFINNENGFLDVSDNLIHEKSVVLHSVLDRFYFDYSAGKFQIRAGRQRINWSQTFVWNPNDLFNNYSFFDFDYEEKPGSDAFLLQYYTNASSQAELAVKANSEKEITAAALYRFNKWSYDLQLITGVLNQNDFVIGTGWSGQVLKGGFRGEICLFQPLENFSDTTGIVALSVGYDYTFNNSLFLQFETLYNSNGSSDREFNLQELYYRPVSAKNLSMNELNFFVMTSYAFTPLLNGSLSAMYSPNDNSVYFGQGLTLSISNNFDLNSSCQVFISDQNADAGGKGAFFFIRFKYNF